MSSACDCGAPLLRSPALQIILDSIPELGCLTPGPDASRQFIDPLFPDLWPTMAAVFAGLNAVFPPEYPFHSEEGEARSRRSPPHAAALLFCAVGGDEVDRNAWATCPSVVAWGASLGVAPADLPRAIADWCGARWDSTRLATLPAPSPGSLVLRFPCHPPGFANTQILCE